MAFLFTEKLINTKWEPAQSLATSCNSILSYAYYFLIWIHLCKCMCVVEHMPPNATFVRIIIMVKDVVMRSLDRSHRNANANMNHIKSNWISLRHFEYWSCTKSSLVLSISLIAIPGRRWIRSIYIVSSIQVHFPMKIIQFLHFTFQLQWLYGFI